MRSGSSSWPATTEAAAQAVKQAAGSVGCAVASQSIKNGANCGTAGSHGDTAGHGRQERRQAMHEENADAPDDCTRMAPPTLMRQI